MIHPLGPAWDRLIYSQSRDEAHINCIMTMERETSDGQPIEGARLCVAALGAESCLAASPPIWGYLRLWLDETEGCGSMRRKPIWKPSAV